MTPSSLVSAQQRARILTEQQSSRAYIMPLGGSVSVVLIGSGPPRKLLIDADGSVAARYVYLPPVGDDMNSWMYQGALPGDDSGVGESNEASFDLSLTTAQEAEIERLGKETNFLAFGYAREGNGVLVLYPHDGVLSALFISDSGRVEAARVG